MKKFILTIFILMIAATSGAYYSVAKPSDSKAPLPEKILPETTTAFFHINHLEETFNEIKNNPLGKNLQQIDVVATAKKLELPEKTINQIKDVYKNLTSENNQKTFFNFFGKNFTIALTSLELPKKNKKGKAEIPDFALLCETKTKADFSKLFSLFSAEIKNEKTFNYKGIKITKSVNKNSYKFFHFKMKKYLIAASTEKAAKKIIDSAKSGETLSTSSDFKEVTPQKNKIYRNSFVFVNLKSIRTEIDNLVSNIPDSKNISSIKGYLKDNINCIAALEYRKKPTLFKSIMKKSLLAAEKIKPEKPKKFTKMVPEDTVGFLWVNNFDFKKFIYDFFNQGVVIDNKNSLKKFEKTAFIDNGFKPEDVYSSLSGKTGIIFSGINTTGMFPVPEIALIFEKKAGKPIEKYINSLINKKILKFAVSTKNINGYSTNYLVMPMGNAIEPSWTYTKKNFIVSVNTALVKKITDTLKSSGNITKNSLYKYVSAEIPKKVNTLYFINTKKFMEDLILTGEALVKLSSMQGPQIAQKAQIILNDILIPLFKGFAAYEGAAGAEYIKGKISTGVSFSKIPD